MGWKAVRRQNCSAELGSKGFRLKTIGGIMKKRILKIGVLVTVLLLTFSLVPLAVSAQGPWQSPAAAAQCQSGSGCAECAGCQDGDCSDCPGCQNGCAECAGCQAGCGQCEGCQAGCAECAGCQDGGCEQCSGCQSSSAPGCSGGTCGSPAVKAVKAKASRSVVCQPVTGCGGCR